MSRALIVFSLIIISLFLTSVPAEAKKSNKSSKHTKCVKIPQRERPCDISCPPPIYICS